jgi:Ca2+-binding RTX toxin-like protein
LLRALARTIVATIDGTDINELLSGTADSDAITGNLGRDTLQGLGGDDVLMSGRTPDDEYAPERIDNFGDELDGGAGNDLIFGATGHDTVYGGEGLDSIYSGSGNDTVYGDAGSDEVYGGSGNDRLYGGEDDDFLIGERGNDRSEGGNGHDRLSDESGTDSLYGGDGDDWLSTVNNNYALDLGLDWLDGGAGNDELESGDGNATLLGGLGDDTLRGGRGTDLLEGGDGNDLINSSIGSANDILRGGDGDDVLIDGAGKGTLEGGAGADSLLGGAGSDTLDGGIDIDTLEGGAGDDVYLLLDGSADLVTELADGGTDMVQVVRSYTLGANIENVWLRSDGAFSLYGNALDNLLIAGLGNNTLYGGSGTDTASYAYASAAVTLSLAVSGAQATGGSGTDTLTLIENLTGSDYADRLTGNALWNVLDGGLGADTLEGGDGSDTYVIDSAADVIVETNADIKTGGSDWVQSKLTGYTLAATLENGVILHSGAANLFGNAANNILVAGSGDNRINGGSGVDTVSYERATAAVTVDLSLTVAQATGGSGSDTLTLIENLTGSAFGDSLKGSGLWNWIDGGAGADTMEGGAGSDTYVVDHLGDVVIESDAELSTGGSDWVYSRLSSYSLGTNIENGAIDIAGTASISGNALDNQFLSGLGDNLIDGGEGMDTVSYLRANAAVTVNLVANSATGGTGTDTLVSIENLAGSSFNDLLIGDAWNNEIRGGTGSDTIRGGDGNDILRGSGNNQGDGVSDSFVFDTAPNGNTNYDRIVAFEGNNLDKILLDPAIYGAIGAQLDASEFRIAANAVDADDFILFDRLTGNLFYDADGNGAGAKVLFAKLINWSGTIDTSDFGMLSPPPAGG